MVQVESTFIQDYLYQEMRKCGLTTSMRLATIGLALALHPRWHLLEGGQQFLNTCIAILSFIFNV